jgi:hypothetical protein
MNTTTTRTTTGRPVRPVRSTETVNTTPKSYGWIGLGIIIVVIGLLAYNYGFVGLFIGAAILAIALFVMKRNWGAAAFGILAGFGIVWLAMNHEEKGYRPKTAVKAYPTPAPVVKNVGGNPPTRKEEPFVPQVKIVQYKDVLIMNGATVEAGPADMFGSGNISYSRIDPRLCGQDRKLLPQHKDAIRAAVALATSAACDPRKPRLSPSQVLQVQLEATRKAFHDLGDDGVVLTPHRDPRGQLNRSEQQQPPRRNQMAYRTR